MYCSQYYTYGNLQPTNFYESENKISLGNVQIEAVPTPGHTPGTTSFFFNITDKTHGQLSVGLHGGVGLNTMTRDYLQDAGFPITLRNEYQSSLRELDQRTVDVSLISHNGHYNMIELLPQKTDAFNPFINRMVWHDLMKKYQIAIKDLIDSGN